MNKLKKFRILRHSHESGNPDLDARLRGHDGKRADPRTLAKCRKVLNKLFLLFLTTNYSLLTTHSLSADWKPATREGVSDYKDGRYDKAAADFERASNLSANNPTVQFNKGCAAFKLKNYESALKSFEQSKAADKKPVAKAESLYNLGNTYLASSKTDAAIEAYKEAILLNPKDPDARHNLAIALKQKPPQDKQDKSDKSKQDQKQNQDQNNKDKKQEESKKQQPPQPQMSPEQLESLLQAFQNEEMNQAKKMQKRKAAQSSNTEEDW